MMTQRFDEGRQYGVAPWAMKAYLQDQFIGRDDAFWGVVFEDDGAGGTYSIFEESGHSGVVCTGFADAIRRKLPHRVRVLGFMCRDNPKAVGIARLADGHDFAVVDGRYVVDPWLTEVESGRITVHTGEVVDLGGRGVFDLMDDDDADLVAALYGDPATWKDVP